MDTRKRRLNSSPILTDRNVGNKRSTLELLPFPRRCPSGLFSFWVDFPLHKTNPSPLLISLSPFPQFDCSLQLLVAIGPEPRNLCHSSCRKLSDPFVTCSLLDQSFCSHGESHVTRAIDQFQNRGRSMILLQRLHSKNAGIATRSIKVS